MDAHALDKIDRVFAPPIECVLHLPSPPSVNRTRKWDPASKAMGQRWLEAADKEIFAAGGMKNFPRMPGPFEAIITLDEKLCGLDLDNSAKSLIDYARRVGLVIDDNKKYMRRVTIEWGRAPRGCRLTLRSVLP